MTDTRSPFEATVALTAAARDISTDEARASVIVESLDWLRHTMSGGAVRIEFETAITRVGDNLDTVAVSHLADAAGADTIAAAGGDDAARFRGDRDRIAAHTLRTVVLAIAPSVITPLGTHS